MKPLFLFLALLGLCSSLDAQFTLSLRGGMGTSSVNVKDQAESVAFSEATAGRATSIGAYGSLIVAPGLSVESGLVSRQYALNISGDGLFDLFGTALPPQYAVDLRMNTLEVPLRIKGSLTLSRVLDVYGRAGVAMNYLRGGDLRVSSESKLNFQQFTSRIDPQQNSLRQWQPSAQAAGGVEIYLNSGANIHLEASYDRQLQPWLRLDNSGAKGSFSTLLFSGGLSIPIGR
ncbi:outer membrane beta-barrel protein [Lewinella sp. W8]|uniref:outer membrane beta-barrel protein n=1 Tax=Lewinella sp. W8 TaxID=2528208 RepID=UPI0010679EEE|nr:outer membrane beta-barrel protein [Lewinella sp. W8]MTB49568.1 outer membrane beta-barrel protein [Lewinella sp. W8]